MQASQQTEDPDPLTNRFDLDGGDSLAERLAEPVRSEVIE